MSNIFDALQMSEAERSGVNVGDLEALKLLEYAERERSDGHRSSGQSADFPVRPTRSSCQMGPEAVLQPLPEGREGENAKLPAGQLEIDDKQRDELMKFIQQVFLMPGAQTPRTVVLAGTEPENGCSWIICRVADMLASYLKRPICIVDANLRSPGLHEVFGLQNHHGLSEALEVSEPIHRFVRPV